MKVEKTEKKKIKEETQINFRGEWLGFSIFPSYVVNIELGEQ